GVGQWVWSAGVGFEPPWSTWKADASTSMLPARFGWPRYMDAPRRSISPNGITGRGGPNCIAPSSRLLGSGCAPTLEFAINQMVEAIEKGVRHLAQRNSIGRTKGAVRNGLPSVQFG